MAEQSENLSPRDFGKFLGLSALMFSGLLTAYAGLANSLIEPAKLPSTYKWFLLQETPGPRLIIESGSNSHHAIDTDRLGEALGMTAINIADNGGYPIEDKLTRLETYTRKGDILVLPLEWTFYYREKLTDDYVSNLFTGNRDYYHSMPLMKKVSRLLSLPPSTVMERFTEERAIPQMDLESPAWELFASSLTQPSGHNSRDQSSGPGPGVASQSCDDYILGKAGVRENLAVAGNIPKILKRLKKIEDRGVNIHFAWPVIAGTGCMTSGQYFNDFRDEIEAVVAKAGFDFLGTPTQSLYPQKYQDDTPYHLTRAGTEKHTEQLVGLLRAEGYGGAGQPLDLSRFAKARLLEMELVDLHRPDLETLPINTTLQMGEEDAKSHVHFTSGWWGFEAYGRWMRDNRSLVQLRLPKNLPQDARLEITGITKSGNAEMLDVSYNGNLIQSANFGNAFSYVIPLKDISEEQLALYFTLPDAGPAQSPFDREENEDQRTMTLHIQTMTLRSNTVAPLRLAPVTKVSKAVEPDVLPRLDVAVKDSPAPAPAPSLAPTPVPKQASSAPLDDPASPTSSDPIQFLEGWWDEEPFGRWMKGQRATLRVAANASGIFPRAIKLSGNLFSGSSHPIEYSINKVVTGTNVFGDGAVVTIDLSDAAGSDGPILVEVKFPEMEISSPKSLGLSNDPRTLAAFINSVEIVPPRL